MNSRPLVSVVIPMYNVKDYIKKTLKSVLEQTYENCEIIIVDDGSDDGCSDIVKQVLSERKNVYYYYQENSGVSAARNTGIRYATGEMIAFIDSDDLWESDKIEKQVERILNQDADACYCGTIDYFEDRKTYVKEKIRYYDGKVLIPFLKDKFWGQTGTWLIKKNLIIDNNIDFIEDCNWGEDFEFFFKVMALGNVTFVKEYLFIYRRRSNSLSEFSFEKLQELDVWCRLKDWIVNVDKLEYDKLELINIIDKFRLPSAAIKIIYESLTYSKNIPGTQTDLFMKKYNINKYVKALNITIGNSSMTMKVLLYRCAISNEKIYRLINSLGKMKFYFKKFK